MAKADVIPVNRDQLVGWLKKLQAGDVHDKKYQAELFDTFLIAVYVYDNPDGQDYMKVVFNYAGSKNTVEIPLDPSVIDNVENIETGAVRLSSAQVHHVVADCISFATTFFKKSSLTHSVAPPLQMRPATLGSHLVFGRRPGGSCIYTVHIDTSSRTAYRSRRLFFEKASLTHFVAAPLQMRPAMLGSHLVFGRRPGGSCIYTVHT